MCRMPTSSRYSSPPSGIPAGDGGEMMRTGAEYRDALRDGRKVWVLGEGQVEDVTTHPATSAMVEEYVAWYDRHLDPAWRDILFAPAAAGREATAWASLLPMTSQTLIRMR